MHWSEFKQAAPELAHVAGERFKKDEVLLLGTVPKDGSPRISPVEQDIANGRLYLRRDPRCVVHGLIHNRMATGGEIKLRGRAVEITDLEERKIYQEAIFKRIGWHPEEPVFHLFAIDIKNAALFQTEEEAQILTQW